MINPKCVRLIFCISVYWLFMFFKLALCVAFAAVCSWAANVRIVVRDPSGAAVPQAAVSIQGDSGQPLQASTNPSGFAVVDLAPGKYRVLVTVTGFEPAEQAIEFDGKTPELVIQLKIAAVETTLDVSGKVSSLLNNDPNYRKLRDDAPASAYSLKGAILKRDAGTLKLTGTVAFLPATLGRSAMAVFTGDGSFHLDPAVTLEKQHIKSVLGTDTIDEEFDSAVFVFTDRTLLEIQDNGQRVEPPAQAADILKRFRSHMRHRIDTPRSQMEAMLFDSEIPNIEADLLAELYNKGQQGSFTAYIRGKHYKDLRFMVKPRGALPNMPSPEEVAVVNVDADGEKDGIWYMTHLLPELQSGSASSIEVKRLFDVEHYRIETTISRGGRLASIADIQVKAREEGPRVVQFSLLPNLRVTRVSIGGTETGYIQESRKADGSFYVILPQSLHRDQSVTLKVEYEGNKVVENEGGGSYRDRRPSQLVSEPECLPAASPLRFDLQSAEKDDARLGRKARQGVSRRRLRRYGMENGYTSCRCGLQLRRLQAEERHR